MRLGFFTAALAISITLGAASPAAADGFSLTLDLDNNLFRLEDLWGGDLGKALEAAPVDHLQFIGSALAEIEIPLGGLFGGTWGMNTRAAACYGGSGETVLFWQNANEDGRLPDTIEIYDLGLMSKFYWQAGLYWRYDLTAADNYRCSVCCGVAVYPAYQSLDLAGQGRLYLSGDGDQGVDIAGSYRLTANEAGSPGFGAAMAWEAEVGFGPGIKASLRIDNLFSLVYFPRLRYENGLIKGEDLPIGPGGVPGDWISGVFDLTSNWITLPLIARADCIWPLPLGHAEANLTWVGETCDLRLTYVWPLNNDLNALLGYDPIMNGFTAGLSWRDASLAVTVNRGAIGLGLRIN